MFAKPFICMNFPNNPCNFATICKILMGNSVNYCNKIRADMSLIYIYM